MHDPPAGGAPHDWLGAGLFVTLVATVAAVGCVHSDGFLFSVFLMESTGCALVLILGAALVVSVVEIVVASLCTVERSHRALAVTSLALAVACAAANVGYLIWLIRALERQGPGG